MRITTILICGLLFATNQRSPKPVELPDALYTGLLMIAPDQPSQAEPFLGKVTLNLGFTCPSWNSHKLAAPTTVDFKGTPNRPLINCYLPQLLKGKNGLEQIWVQGLISTGSEELLTIISPSRLVILTGVKPDSTDLPVERLMKQTKVLPAGIVVGYLTTNAMLIDDEKEKNGGWLVSEVNPDQFRGKTFESALVEMLGGTPPVSRKLLLGGSQDQPVLFKRGRSDTSLVVSVSGGKSLTSAEGNWLVIERLFDLKGVTPDRPKAPNKLAKLL